MPDSKQIVCLANSRKLSGRCIAGREWDPKLGVGDWVRPVSNRPKQEVSEYERRYEGGGDPRLLDVIDIPVLQPCPQSWQTENWLINDQFHWTRNGQFPLRQLAELADPVEPLWVDGQHTYHGRNDKVPLGLANTVSSSLRLIQVEKLGLAIFKPGEAFGDNKRRVQGRFRHAGKDYWLRITDPGCEREYLSKPDGHYEIGERYLTVSLGEEYQGACYKLIAGIIQRG